MKVRPSIAMSDEGQAIIVNGIAWPYDLFRDGTTAAEGAKFTVTRANNCMGYDPPKAPAPKAPAPKTPAKPAQAAGKGKDA